MFRLSTNFKLSEFTKSATAKRRGIDNIPDKEDINNLQELVINVLQPLREIYGHSISINSGYRSSELNIAIGGAKTSQHCSGEAADVDTVDNNTQLFNIIKDHLEFDQLIAEFYDNGQPAWIHVSYSTHKNRKWILIAAKVDGKTKYLPYSDETYNSIYK